MNVYKLNGQLVRLIQKATYKTFKNPAKEIRDVSGDIIHTKDDRKFEVKLIEKK